MTSNPRDPTRRDLRRLAAFHQLSLNPVFVVNAAGGVASARDGARETGRLPEGSARCFRRHEAARNAK